MPWVKLPFQLMVPAMQNQAAWWEVKDTPQSRNVIHLLMSLPKAADTKLVAYAVIPEPGPVIHLH